MMMIMIMINILRFSGRDLSNCTLSDFDRIRSKSDGAVTNLNKISQPCR